MFFLDSYAMLEIARGNPKYRSFIGESVITSRSNLLEVYCILLEHEEEALAKKVLEILGPIAADLPLELIPKVAYFRRRRLGATGRRFSYVDALGYVIARENGFTFLTGAQEFEGFPEVRFVR